MSAPIAQESTVLLVSLGELEARQARHACQTLGCRVESAPDLDHAAPILDARTPDLVLCPHDLFTPLRRVWPQAPAVLLAQTGDSEQTIEAIKLGALDCLIHPLRHADMVKRLGDALQLARDEKADAAAAPLRPPAPGQQHMVGHSPAMQELFRLIGLIAPRDVNVLITGESGTGKELVARAIHEHSLHPDKPFLAVNCAAIPETLLESELFGHEKGAFTGADARRIGKFEQAHGGTLFFDEVGDMPLATQVKLLRVLQDQKFQRLGGAELVTCDVRIIAATHQPLEELIAQKRFRQDLYYRLKVATLHVPPLREREVDVVLLAHYFVERFNPQFRTAVRHFHPEVVSALLAYPWPGNVRELENVIKSALVVARGPILRADFLPDPLHRHASPGQLLGSIAPVTLPASPPAPAVASPAGSLGVDKLIHDLSAQSEHAGRLFDAVIQAVERRLIENALNRTAGHLQRAAGLLGISRTTLRAKMRRHNLQLGVADAQPPLTPSAD